MEDEDDFFGDQDFQNEENVRKKIVDNDMKNLEEDMQRVNVFSMYQKTTLKNLGYRQGRMDIIDVYENQGFKQGFEDGMNQKQPLGHVQGSFLLARNIYEKFQKKLSQDIKVQIEKELNQQQQITKQYLQNQDDQMLEQHINKLLELIISNIEK